MREVVIEFLISKEYGFWYEPIRQAYLIAWLQRDQENFQDLIYEADSFSFNYVNSMKCDELEISNKAQEYSQYMFCLLSAYLDPKEEDELRHHFLHK